MSDTNPEHATSEVGFKKPPKHAQFKPGQSGNPRDHQKPRPETLSEAVAHELHKLHTLKGSGRPSAPQCKRGNGSRLVEDAANEDLQAFVVPDWTPGRA